MMETGLRDKVVIVTGGCRHRQGDGPALRPGGCRVASWDVKDAAPEEGGMFQKVDVASAAGGSGGRTSARPVGCDSRAGQQCGILRDGQLVKYKAGAVTGLMSDEQFDAVIGVNLKACSRARGRLCRT